MEENEWIEKQLPNGDMFHIIRFYYENKPEKNKDQIKNNQSQNIGSGIKIRNKNKAPESSLIIFLTNNNELVGYVDCSFRDDEVYLSTDSYKMKELLYYNFGIFRKDKSSAINTEEKFRHQHKGTILLIILFEYLVSIGIKNVSIYGITNLSSFNFYLSNGITLYDNQKKEIKEIAIYKKVKDLLKNLNEKNYSEIEKTIIDLRIDISNGVYKDIATILPHLYKKVENQLGGKIDAFNNLVIRK